MGRRFTAGAKTTSGGWGIWPLTFTEIGQNVMLPVETKLTSERVKRLLDCDSESSASRSPKRKLGGRISARREIVPSAVHAQGKTNVKAPLGSARTLLVT